MRNVLSISIFTLLVNYLAIAQNQNPYQPLQENKIKELVAFNKILKAQDLDINLISEYQSQVDSFKKEKIITEKDSLFKSVLYHKLGVKWYYPKWRITNEQSDFIKLIRVTEKSLEIKKKLNLTDCSVNQLLNNLGWFRKFNLEYVESIKNFKEVVSDGYTFCSKKRKFGDNKIYNSTIGLVSIYNSYGDSHKAIGYLEDFLFKYDKQISEETRLKLHIELANAFSVMSFIDFSNEIKNNLSKANEILKNNNFEKEQLFRSQINIIEGNRLELKQEYNKAILLHKKVINDLYEIDNEDSLNIAHAYNSLGLSQLIIKDYKNSYSNLRKAISYNLYYTSPYNNLGDYYVDYNDYKKALENYQKAIVYSYNKNEDAQIEYTNLPTINEIEISDEKISLLNHLVTKAEGWIKFYEYDANKNHLKQALKTFKLADQLIDVIRFQSKEYQSKLFWRKQGASLYLKAVKVCYLLNKPEEAFYFMERNKALLLLADITNEKAKEITNLPNEISEKEFLLKNAIYLAENDVYENKLGTKDTLKAYKDRLYLKKTAYEKFVDSLEQVFPQYAKFKKKIEVLDLKNLREKYISEHKYTLHYLLDDEVGYGLLTTPDEQLLFDLEVSKGLINDVGSLSKQLSGDRIDFKNFAAVSHSVFNALIPDSIYAKIKGKNITVVSDHILQKLPFDVLISDRTHTRYLIEDTEISYVYSMSHLDQNTSKEKKYSKEYVGFASEKFDNEFADLLYTNDEVNEVSELFNGDTFFDQNATKSHFLNSSAGYKIVHVSTHAGIKENTPYIAFKDSLVNINEVYASKINPELLVLSACNTSDGEIKAGEGVMSLARGFFYSGTKSIVSSLWSINDKSTNYIINEFYKNLKESQSKSSALRNAKLSYLNKNNENKLSPNLWGALILIGNSEPIQSLSFLEKYQFYLLVVVFIVFMGFLFKKKISSVLSKKIV